MKERNEKDVFSKRKKKKKFDRKVIGNPIDDRRHLCSPDCNNHLRNRLPK